MQHSLIFYLVLISSQAFAHPAHSHTESRQLPSDSWHHDERSPLHSLFRRDGAATNFPQVGSPTWMAAYPTSTPDTTKTPPAWTSALNTAIAAGKIPNIPPTTLVNGYPTYPTGFSESDPTVCSATAKCKAPSDVWDSPVGTIGIGFDDGPVGYTGSSHVLYDFLKQNNQIATHFMIGVAILQAPTVFLEAFNNGGDIAVHTYTHPYMTTLSNEDVLAQLGWTMQIIYDSTNGRIPKFWRPPSGNMDNRVRAIASEVFGLTPILWNRDSEDWTMTQPGGTTPALLASNLTSWIAPGPKNTPTGLIILQHELTNDTVKGFTDAYPQMLAAKWKTTSVARLVPSSMGDKSTGNVYWNADNGNKGTVRPGGVTDNGDIVKNPPPVVSSSAPASSSVASTAPAHSSNAPSSPSSSAPSSSSSAPTQAGNQSKSSGAISSVLSLPSLSSWLALVMGLSLSWTL